MVPRVFVSLLRLVNLNTVFGMKQACRRIQKGIGFPLVWLLIFGSQVVAQQEAGLHGDIAKLHTVKGERFRDAVAELYDSVFTISDYSIRQQYLDTLFAITAQEDEVAHIRSLVYQVMLSGNPRPSLFDQAYQLAAKHNRVDDINFVEYSRGQYYIARKQYDSAMIHILRYRDNTPANLQDEGYRNILNLLGDVYYNARLYDQAMDIYSELLAQYALENNWNFYRPYVMMNNLGQIAYNRGNYGEATEWFTRSLTLAEEHLQESYRNNTLAYIRIKLAETALMIDSLTNAAHLLQEVEAYPRQTLYEDVWQEYIYARGRLLFKQGKINEAMELARHLLPGDTLHFSEYRFIPEGYRLLAEIYRQTGDYSLALDCMDNYDRLTDSLWAQEHLVQSMIILADRNHEQTLKDLEKTRYWVYNLVFGLAFLLIVLVVVLFLYHKLYRSKLALVRKSLEKNIVGAFVHQKQESGLVNGEEARQQQELIIALNQFMEANKPYLDPKLSMQDMSRQLSTNRTYLSRAINNQLKSNFPNYINEYRIREAVKWITSGYTVSHTQEALAKECAFANRTAFGMAFKKHTGVTPSFFAANYDKG